MQKHVNLVDLVKSFPTNIYLQNLASIQKRTSPLKFAHLAEKSGKGSISKLSTKVAAALRHLHPAHHPAKAGNDVPVSAVAGEPGPGARARPRLAEDVGARVATGGGSGLPQRFSVGLEICRLQPSSTSVPTGPHSGASPAAAFQASREVRVGAHGFERSAVDHSARGPCRRCLFLS